MSASTATEAGNKGWTAPVVVVTGLVGIVALGAFVVVEERSPHPMLPLDVFRSRQFTAANLVTFVVYGALGGALFLLPLELQRGAGFSPLNWCTWSAMNPVWSRGSRRSTHGTPFTKVLILSPFASMR